jgi:hypothetical protein
MQDRAARDLISLTIAPGTIDFTGMTTSAAALLDAYIAHYGPLINAEQARLKQELSSLEMDQSSESLGQYYERVTNLVAEMAKYKIKPSDEEHLTALKKKVPLFFYQTALNYETSRSSVTPEQLRCLLLTQEKNLVTYKIERRDVSHSRALKSSGQVSGGSNASPQLGGRNTVRCDFCESPEHKKPDCDEFKEFERKFTAMKQRQASRRHGDGGKRLPRNPGRGGGRGQPKNPQPGKIAPNPSTASADKAQPKKGDGAGDRQAGGHAWMATSTRSAHMPDTWILDSGATFHMTGNFEILSAPRPVQQRISGVGGLEHYATHVGSVELVGYLPDGKMSTITLNQVYYFPDIAENIISGGLIDSAGYSLRTTKGSCTVLSDANDSASVVMVARTAMLALGCILPNATLLSQSLEFYYPRHRHPSPSCGINGWDTYLRLGLLRLRR